MPADSQKICVACNKSCDGQPRIKDPKGRYFHQQCYEEVKRAHKQKQREQERAAADAFNAPPVGTSADAGDDDIMSMLLDDAAASPSAPPVIPRGGGTCPSCGQAMSAGAVICMNCGFNAQSGHAVHTNVAAAPRAASGGNIWPTVIGVICIIYAVINLGNIGLNALQSLSAPNIIGIVFAGLFALLYIWLLVSAVGVLKRSQDGFANLRRWSIVTTILYATCFSIFFVGFFMVRDRIEQNLPPNMSGFAEILIVLMVALAIWHLAWPVFCFVWTGRSTIQQQVNNW